MILVSNSPRRQEILKNAGFDFQVVSSTVKEEYPENLAIEKIPEYLAEQKAYSVVKDYKDEILIAADTIVVLKNTILGKPKNDIEAVEMLEKLSGKKHRVISGGCVVKGDDIIKFSDETTVYFKDLSNDEIMYYVENFKPFDKAGAYGIQEWIGMIGIEKIQGSFYNVMGLPIHKLYEILMNIKRV